MRIRWHRGFGHGLRPGDDRDIGCRSCQRESAEGKEPEITDCNLPDTNREISTDPHDWRVQTARAHPGLGLKPPVLVLCAVTGCVNTVIKGEETLCLAHQHG